MEAVYAISIGIVTACGIYLVLRPRTFSVVLGLTLLSYAVNLYLFSTGRLVGGRPPIFDPEVIEYTDPLPQALVLTAIVIGLAMTAFAVVVALRMHVEVGHDHVDGTAHRNAGESSRKQRKKAEARP
jgi:multicomponent K+:H+ antiporter subunit C